MLGYYDYTVILTYMSVASSVVGMCLAVQGKIFAAVVCLMISGLCDMFDGMVARTKKNRTENEKKFGIQLDSLADVVCFGAFPALLGNVLANGTKFQYVMLTISVIFVLCAVIRLAYFNVTEDQRQKETEGKRKAYDGLPVTFVALMIPILFCAKEWLQDTFYIAYALVLLLIAVCFVIKVKVKKLGKIGNIIMIVIGILVFAILVAMNFR